jgi:hypothetical protein
MSPMRNLLRTRRWLAMLIVAVSLCVRALIPAGFMVTPASQTQSIVLQICSGSSLKSVTLALPSSHDDGKDRGKQADTPCAFTALAMGADHGADPLQLALALAFILLLGFTQRPALPLASRTHILPPQCGPPAFA